MSEKKQLEENLRMYFKNLSERRKLEYELIILQDMKQRIEKVIEIDNSEKTDEERKRILKRIYDRNMKVVELLHADIDMGIEYKFQDLDAESKRMIELRYKKNKTLLSVADEVHLSKSTVLRKIDKILNQLE